MPPPSQWRHMRKDGTVIEVEIHSHTVRFDGHDARLVLAHDITARAGLERQLRQAQKMEAVGRLAGGVAHDFNNLLAVIMAHGELIGGMTGPDDPRHENLAELLAATQRAHGLTRQLLTFSRQHVFSTSTIAVNIATATTARIVVRGFVMANGSNNGDQVQALASVPVQVANFTDADLP
jgi:signal transduction histidine kinase